MKNQRTLKILWILAFITATLPFWDLGHPLWEVDDARYAEVPREMVEGGDWLTPSLNYVEYLQKPPLIYWLGASSYELFGVSETTAHLPLALLSLLGLAGIGWLGMWMFSLETGLMAVVILGTCVEYVALSYMQTPDMALAVCLLWCSAFILRALHRPRDAWWTAPAAGAMAGFAFLSKGLVGFVFPAAWLFVLAVFFPEVRKGARALCLSWAAPVAVLVIAPWLWAMSTRHSNFLYHFRPRRE